MNRIELYVNNEDKLTLEFFLNKDSEFSMCRMEGAKCYGLISEICTQKILGVKQSSNGEDIMINYENYILNVSEHNITLKKRGAIQIKNCIVKYLQDKKRKELEKEKSKSNNNEPKPLKVTRKNKYNCKKIIAPALVLISLVSVLILKPPTKDNSSNTNSNTSYSDVIEENSDDLVYEEENNENLDNDNSLNLFISFDDRSQTEKARIAKAYYQSAIEKYSKMYGLDPKIIMAIATQERGIHSETMDAGGATGLMQIQNSVWVGENLTAYNYEKNEYETVFVTKEDLSDVFKNIKYGCMIFQNCLGYMNNNTLAAIQCYNMGYGNMMSVLKSYSAECGKSITEILKDFSDYNWLEHRDIIRVGDQKYLEHVLSWIGSEININNLDDRGNVVEINITNESQRKNMSFN